MFPPCTSMDEWTSKCLRCKRDVDLRSPEWTKQKLPDSDTRSSSCATVGHLCSVHVTTKAVDGASAKKKKLVVDTQKLNVVTTPSDPQGTLPLGGVNVRVPHSVLAVCNIHETVDL